MKIPLIIPVLISAKSAALDRLAFEHEVYIAGLDRKNTSGQSPYPIIIIIALLLLFRFILILAAILSGTIS
jgi:hypothetical protein